MIGENSCDRKGQVSDKMRYITLPLCGGIYCLTLLFLRKKKAAQMFCAAWISEGKFIGIVLFKRERRASFFERADQSG